VASAVLIRNGPYMETLIMHDDLPRINPGINPRNAPRTAPRTVPRISRQITDRWCVGIDLHKDTLFVVALDPRTGETIEHRLSCKCREQIVEFFKVLPRPQVVAIESVGFYRWLWELLEPVVDELQLADATQCRALAGRRIKTDREDALNVAELLAAGRLPRAWAPPSHLAALRDVTRHRHYLSKQHARVLHRVKSIMAQVNRPGPDRLRAPTLMRYLKAQREKLPEHLADQIEMAIDELTLLERQLDRIDVRLKAKLQSPRFAPQTRRLMSFPGVKWVLAGTILAEVGDFERFDHRDGITRYAGLDPRVFSSAESTRTGAIAKCGSRELRWALVQAAWVAVRCDDHYRKRWLKIKSRNDGKRAIIAIARRLLLAMRAAEQGKTPRRLQPAA
jgi:transposase